MARRRRGAWGNALGGYKNQRRNKGQFASGFNGAASYGARASAGGRSYNSRQAKYQRRANYLAAQEAKRKTERRRKRIRTAVAVGSVAAVGAAGIYASQRSRATTQAVPILRSPKGSGIAAKGAMPKGKSKLIAKSTAASVPLEQSQRITRPISRRPARATNFDMSVPNVSGEEDRMLPDLPTATGLTDYDRKMAAKGKSKYGVTAGTDPGPSATKIATTGKTKSKKAPVQASKPTPGHEGFKLDASKYQVVKKDGTPYKRPPARYADPFAKKSGKKAPVQDSKPTPSVHNDDLAAPTPVKIVTKPTGSFHAANATLAKQMQAAGLKLGQGEGRMNNHGQFVRVETKATSGKKVTSPKPKADPNVRSDKDIKREAALKPATETLKGIKMATSGKEEALLESMMEAYESGKADATVRRILRKEGLI